MDKMIDNFFKSIDEYIKESDDELRIFKVMFLLFYIYYGQDHKYIDPKNKLYKVRKKDKDAIEKEFSKYNFLGQNVELYKLGMKYDKFMESTNRVKTGSYYTPEDLAKGIVNLTISDYFKLKDENLYNFFRSEKSMTKLKNLDDLDADNLELMISAYRKLIKLNVVDLSCGTGMFLISFVKLIIDIRLKIDSFIKKLDLSLSEKLENFNLDKVYGFDIQENPLNILRLSLVDLLMRYDFLVSQELSIKCFDTLKVPNDSILLDPSIKDGFDIVFGNPPYIGEKGNKDLFIDIRESEFGARHYEGKMDYFYYFIYKGVSLLKDDGVLGYISTNYFVSADGALNLRDYLKSNCTFLSVLNFNDLILFPSAPGQHNMIFTLKRKDQQSTTSITVISREESNRDYNVLKNVEKFAYLIDESSLYDENGNIILMKDSSYHEIIALIIKKSNIKISDFISVKQGIVSGADKVSKLMLNKKFSKKTIETYNLKKDDPIFVIDSLKKVDVEDELIKPFYKNSCIDTYFTEVGTDKHVIYINDEIDDFQNKYPRAFKHFIKYREVLSSRREVENGMKAWYLLQWGRSEDVFSQRRIVVPQRSSRNKFALSTKDFYGSADIYYLYIKNNMNLDESNLNYYLLGILNSKLYYFWLYNMGKRKGNLLELYSKPISQIPIYLDADSEFYDKILTLVKDIFVIGKDSNNLRASCDEIEKIKMEIDKSIYEMYLMDEIMINKIEALYKKNVTKKT